jgi:hypothetical protein
LSSSSGGGGGSAVVGGGTENGGGRGVPSNGGGGGGSEVVGGGTENGGGRGVSNNGGCGGGSSDGGPENGGGRGVSNNGGGSRDGVGAESVWVCSSCTTHNPEREQTCDSCSTPKEGYPVAALLTLHMEGDDFSIRGYDGEDGVDTGGRLIGPDGKPLRPSPHGLSDRDLRLRREASLAAPSVPFFTEGNVAVWATSTRPSSRSGRGGDKQSPGGSRRGAIAKKMTSAARVVAFKESAMEHRRHVASIRVERETNTAAVATTAKHQARLAAEKAAEAAAVALARHRAEKKVLVEQQRAARRAAKEQHQAVMAAKAAEKKARRRERTRARALMGEKSRREAERGKRNEDVLSPEHPEFPLLSTPPSDGDAVPLPGSANLGLGPAVPTLRASYQSEVNNRPTEIAFLADSGAGATCVTAEVARLWGGPTDSSIDVVDIRDKVTTARGGGPMFGHAFDTEGKRVRVQLAREAFGSKHFGVNLFSIGAAQSDNLWEPHLEGTAPFVESADGTRVPLIKTLENTYELTCDIEPWSETVRLQAAASDTSVSWLKKPFGWYSMAAAAIGRLKPNGRGARLPTVRWPEAFDGLEGTVSEKGVRKKGVKSMTPERRQEQERRYAYYHQCFGHRDGVVDEAIRRGVIDDAVKPEGWRCGACEIAKPTSNAFGSVRREEPLPSFGPWRRVQADVYGPVKCNDRNGFEYLFAAICEATGASFIQPMRAKSDAVKALKAFAKWVALLVDVAEVTLGLAPRTIKLGQLRTDRGGEFTTTWGATASEFDEVAVELFQGRWFGSPGVPQSATPHVERFWGTLRNSADASMISSGMPSEFKYYAMCHANFTYNHSTTSANKLGKGAAPFQTLGAHQGLQRLVPFGCACVVKVPSNEKGTVANVRGRIIGYPSDGPGYIVALDPDPSKPLAQREVISSVDVVPRRVGAVWDTDAAGDMVRQGPLPPEVPTEDYVLLPTPAAARAAETMGPALSTAPVVQTVGAAPGDSGSRAALLPRRSRGSRRVNRAELSKEAGVALVTAAAAAGRTFAFRQENPKQHQSRARYEVYKSATTFAELDAMKKLRLPDGRPVIKRGIMSKHGDFVSDVCHHFVEFLEAAPVGGSVSPLTVAAMTAEGGGAAVGQQDDVAVGSGAVVPPVAPSSVSECASAATAAPWKSRLRRRVRVGAATGGAGGPSMELGKGKGDVEVPLSVAEASLLREVRAWPGASAAVSKRRSVGVGADVPYRLVRAAVADTTGGATLEEAIGDGVVKVFDIKGAGVPFVPRVLPRSFAELRKEPDWASGILPAIKTEIAGLMSANVYDVVPWEPWMHGDIIRTHRLDSVKPDKYKARFVAQGNNTRGDGVHYDEVATSMAAQTSVKITVAFAAGNGYDLYAIDFKQAFLQADVANPNLYIDLPELPFEMEGGEYGPGKGKGMVGRLKKTLYGLKDSPRLFSIHLRKFLTSGAVGVKLLSSDRNVFKWSFQGETLSGCIHVDDVLFAPSGEAIRKEFLRRVQLSFEITGGEQVVSKFCGYEFRYDKQAQTITMHQESFVRAVLDKYDMLEVKPVDTPMLVGATPLQPWAGVATDRQTFDYAMFVGDLTWMTRTNPRLAFAAQDLSQFVANPGPDHVIAARRVLAHLKLDPGRGLTFHGSSTVLDQSYPHRHSIIGMVDSGFSHKGVKAVSGVTVLMNGAAIVHISRRQATVSNTSTEAEVKAAALMAEVLAAVVPLWSELAGARHPAVRCLIDNKGAKRQIESGTDTAASAPYLRSKCYAECKLYSGLMWLDLVPGEKNGADMATKQVRDTAEFKEKDGIISGSRPFLHESAEITRILKKLGREQTD